MRTIRFFLLIFLLIPFFNQSIAQSSDTLPSPKTKRGSWVLLPAISASPETSFAFGVIGMYLFRFDRYDTRTRTSNVQSYTIYTLNKQILTETSYNLFSNGEKWFLRGNIAFFQFPEYFYGIGDNPVPTDDREQVDYTFLRIENRLLRRVKGHFFAGLQYRYLRIADVEIEPGKILDNTRPFGYQGSRSSGAGFALLFDSRDKIVTPSRGSYLELSTLYHGGLGGTARFDAYRLDIRKYLPIWKDKGHVLALQLFGQFTSGTPPVIRQYAELGNDQTMRGYYRGAYRDKNLLAFQAEYRFPVWKFIGLTAFGGLGSVSPDRSSFDTWLPNFGLGLRVKVNKKDDVNIRADYGFGKDISNFYLNIGEAF